MSNYRRTSKPKTEHIKKGFTVFQKTVATIASILGLITASITIMNALDNNKNIKKEPTTSQTTTIVKEIQKKSKRNPLRKTPVQLKRLTLVKKKHSKRKHQNLASRKRKKKIRKQQLRTLLLLLQVNLLLKTKNSPMRQLQKIKAINSQKNSFPPNLERSYFFIVVTLFEVWYLQLDR